MVSDNLVLTEIAELLMLLLLFGFCIKLGFGYIDFKTGNYFFNFIDPDLSLKYEVTTDSGRKKQYGLLFSCTGNTNLSIGL